MRFLAMLLFALPLHSQEVPAWVTRGILKVETRSVLLVDGEIVYMDRRRGAAGERGPFQMRRVAFRQVAKPGESFADIETNPEFAREVAHRYLLWLRFRSISWNEAVESYNAGPGNRAPQYLRHVRNAGKP